jgi:hypothetical protein
MCQSVQILLLLILSGKYLLTLKHAAYVKA